MHCIYKIEYENLKDNEFTRLSNRLLEQGYVKESLKSSFRKFYGRYWNLIKQYEVSLSQILNDILWPIHIQWQPPTDQTLYRTRPCTVFCGFLRTFATCVACRQGTLTPPDTWSRPFGTCICSTCWDQSVFRTCRYLSGLCSSNIPRHFLDFAYFQHLMAMTKEWVVTSLGVISKSQHVGHSSCSR